MRTCLILLLIALFSLPSLAADRPTHTVRQGETLFSISRQYEVTVDQIRQWNGLRNNVISVGQELIVGDGSRPGQRPPAERPRPDTQDGTIIHTVEPGQTLFRISRIYDVTVDQIKEWNNLRDNLISIGQELEIRRPGELAEVQPDTTPADHTRPESQRDEQPQPDEQPPVADRPPVTGRVDTVPRPTDDPDPVPPSRAATDDDDAIGEPATPAFYEVRPGDTLYRIASRFNMTVQELMEYNELESSRIDVGQQLRIRSRPPAPPSVAAEWDVDSTPQGRFATYTFREGDSLHQILQHHNMDMHEFRALNPGVSAGDLRPGDEVTLIIAATTRRNNPYLSTVREENGTQMQVTRYPEERQRKTTTSGDLYNPQALTAAHPNMALGSVAFIENPENGRGIFVHINDRTPENRLVLSDAAFRALDFQNSTRLVATIREMNDN